ncbi:uncharacterized protein C8Q71DRAFT_860058 [Rhodofomes roseus]|uniref:DUF7918 domain-containing protein n=1 Tax=Rhodofomes roseus TaxID=34475 RepID=A0ABQ8K8Z5_9APHY|nr:uncharacterized protein C8Q71DRAFT_860058 [Rhodofomes roseus]KAH9833786.1 hypothetical protein C8Q71DRAFT_860058 [Rhodofomes roseus]
MKLRDIEVNISSADSHGQLAEFAHDAQDERTISCYIVSEAGKTFAINIHNGLEGKTVIADCYMDGEYAEVDYAKPGDWSELRGVYISVSESVAMERVFTFANIQVTDDESAQHDVQDLGSVEVRVYRIVMGECWAPDASAETWVGSDKPVNELSKKAGLHRIALADAAPVEVMDHIDYTPIDGVDDPYVTFRFMYRPRDILKAQGIIPLSPSPETNNTECANSNTRQVSSSPEAGLSSAPQRADKRRASESTTRAGEQGQASKRPRQASTEEDVKPNLDDIKPHIEHSPEPDNASIASESAEQIVRYLCIQLDNAKHDLAEKEQIVRYLGTQLENAERDLAGKRGQRGGRVSAKREQADRSVSATSSAVIDLTVD